MHEATSPVVTTDAIPKPNSLYSSGISVTAADGSKVELSTYQGKVLLVVNVASQCGYTKTNYEGLQMLYSRYAQYGFQILAFPCNQFGSQEPGTLDEILAFTSSTYKVTFPIMSKVDVNGDGASELFRWLKVHSGPSADAPLDISWNFNKFLVGKDGRVVKRYASAMVYSELENDVYQELIR